MSTKASQSICPTAGSLALPTFAFYEQQMTALANVLAGNSAGSTAEARAAYDLAVERGHPRYTGELAYWRWQGGEISEPPAEILEPFALQIAGDWQATARAWDDLGRP